MYGNPILRQINNPAANNTIPGVSAAVPGVAAVTGSAAGTPLLCVSSYSGSQVHYIYLDNNGNVWDAFEDRNTREFNLQQIRNPGGETPAAAAGPFVGLYSNQQHIVWISGGNVFSLGEPDVGTIWDCWYDGKGWHFQRINNAHYPTNYPGVYSATSGPQAAFDSTLFAPPGIQGPSFSVAIWNWLGQQHFTYACVTGTVFDAFWDGGQWHLQQINQSYSSSAPPPPPPQGNTGAPLALGDPYAGVYQIFANINPQEHIAYRDFSAIIWDCWFDPAAVGHRNPWSKQQINVGRGNPPSGSRPLTEAPAAVLGPVVWNSDTQQHFTFLGDSGKLWDAWYDWRTNGWSSRQINLGAAGGETTPANAPEAAGVPYVCSWGADDLPPTQHIVYRDLNGGIRDLWLDVVNDTWHADLLNMGGVFGNVPPAAGDPFVWTYSDQYLTDIHFTYRDANGTVWDMGYFMGLPIEGRG